MGGSTKKEKPAGSGVGKTIDVGPALNPPSIVSALSFALSSLILPLCLPPLFTPSVIPSLPFLHILILYLLRPSIQHRSLQPTVPPTQGPSQPPSHTRLSECLDTIRSEFDVLSQDIVHLRNQRDEFDTKGLPSSPFIRVHPTFSFLLSSR
jgi:hypothetical protein